MTVMAIFLMIAFSFLSRAIWLKVKELNGAVRSLPEEMKEYRESVERGVDRLCGDIGRLREKGHEMQEEIDRMTGDVKSFQKRLDVLHDGR